MVGDFLILALRGSPDPRLARRREDSAAGSPYPKRGFGNPLRAKRGTAYEGACAIVNADMTKPSRNLRKGRGRARRTLDKLRISLTIIIEVYA